MLLRLLKTGQMIPAMNAGAILELQIVPKNECAFLMFSGNQILVTRGRFINKGTGMTSITPRQNMHPTYGDPSGLEANIGTAITSTTLVAGNSHGMPYFQLLQDGNSSAVRDMEFMLGIGFPVAAVTVLSSVVPGFAVGDNLAMKSGVNVAW